MPFKRAQAWVVQASVGQTSVTPLVNLGVDDKTHFKARATTEDLLEQLINLEAALSADLARKPKHQKKAKQVEMQKYINRLKETLGL